MFVFYDWLNCRCVYVAPIYELGNEMKWSVLVLGTGTRVTGYPFQYPFQYPLPGYPADTRVPGYHSIPVLFFSQS